MVESKLVGFGAMLIFLFVFAGCTCGQNCKSNDESEKDMKARCRSPESYSKESTKSSSPGSKKNNSDSDDCCCQVDKVGLGRKKPCCSSSKINDSSAGGVLRYALHLRFLCPSKKSSKSMLRCKSDPSSAPYNSNTVAEEERRFYLYNDLRVVFPQRHSDSDEGEVRKPILAFSISSFHHQSETRLIYSIVGCIKCTYFKDEILLFHRDDGKPSCSLILE